MRAVATQYPYGRRLRGQPTRKCHGVLISPRDGQDLRYSWITNYEPDTWLHAQLDLAASVGANTVKWLPDIHAYINGGNDLALMKQRLSLFCEHALSIGIDLVWQTPIDVFGWGGDPANLPALLDFAADIDRYGNVVYWDVLPESHFYTNAATAAAIAEAVFPAIREVTKIPLTASLSGNPNTQDAFIAALDPWVDLFDWHLYYYFFNDADLAEYRALPTARPFVIGEFGISPAGGPNDVVTQIEEVGTTFSSLDCWGALYFPLVDYVGPLGDSYSGLYDGDFVPHEAELAAFVAMAG